MLFPEYIDSWVYPDKSEREIYDCKICENPQTLEDAKDPDLAICNYCFMELKKLMEEDE